jgi:hypothetical protein
MTVARATPDFVSCGGRIRNRMLAWRLGRPAGRLARRSLPATPRLSRGPSGGQPKNNRRTTEDALQQPATGAVVPHPSGRSVSGAQRAPRGRNARAMHAGRSGSPTTRGYVIGRNAPLASAHGVVIGADAQWLQ